MRLPRVTPGTGINFSAAEENAVRAAAEQASNLTIAPGGKVTGGMSGPTAIINSAPSHCIYEIKEEIKDPNPADSTVPGDVAYTDNAILLALNTTGGGNEHEDAGDSDRLHFPMAAAADSVPYRIGDWVIAQYNTQSGRWEVFSWVTPDDSSSSGESSSGETSSGEVCSWSGTVRSVEALYRVGDYLIRRAKTLTFQNGLLCSVSAPSTTSIYLCCDGSGSSSSSGEEEESSSGESYDSSSSSGDDCECCDGTPESYRVVFSGVTNGDCESCPDWNGANVDIGYIGGAQGVCMWGGPGPTCFGAITLEVNCDGENPTVQITIYENGTHVGDFNKSYDPGSFDCDDLGTGFTWSPSASYPQQCLWAAATVVVSLTP